MNVLRCDHCGGPITLRNPDDKATLTTTITVTPDESAEVTSSVAWCPRCLRDFDERLGFEE